MAAAAVDAAVLLLVVALRADAARSCTAAAAPSR